MIETIESVPLNTAC